MRKGVGKVADTRGHPFTSILYRFSVRIRLHLHSNVMAKWITRRERNFTHFRWVCKDAKCDT